MILLGEGEAADAKRRLLTRAGALVVGEDAAASLAIVALDEPDEAVARLRARGVLVNAVDRPDLCDFTLPAIVDRDPVLIAIGTGGASAGLAKVLRQRIEAMLPATLGRLADALYAARGDIRRRWPAADQRRRAIDMALAGGGPLDPVTPLAGDAVAGWLAAPDQAAPAGLVVILLRSPDPDDLSLREARLLGQCDRIYHRPDVPAAILDRARADAVRIAAQHPVGGAPGLTIDLGWSDR
ncbi:precorrin-2 dehydrogenase/sirohydrochlorin ferrochelatase family protein [Sphingomonas solaris]|uniref:precorrin-2 dehydrogenase n=1 Tax=Alterirhizorhabdus solaris TaxID=2529389 RepID=A0A558R663_9SPHN|nr:NAD(P)-dependent oxidoreductase [Sphingomonas solaris]TVV74874.1 siroheme synthase [Sphingomonas solaris]